MRTIARKMLELNERCNCIVSSVIMWRNARGDVNRVYIYDPDTALVVENLQNLQNVPVVLRYRLPQMRREYNVQKTGVRDVKKIRGRTPRNKSIRNENEVPADTLFDLIAKKDIVIRAYATPPPSPCQTVLLPDEEDPYPEETEVLFKTIVDLSTYCTNMMPVI